MPGVTVVPGVAVTGITTASRIVDMAGITAASRIVDISGCAGIVNTIVRKVLVLIDLAPISRLFRSKCLLSGARFMFLPCSFRCFP